MNLETVYNFLNVVVLPFWLMMILAPRWSVTRKVINSIWPFAIVPVIYVGTIIAMFAQFEPVVLDFSLSGINAMFSSETATLVLWAHIIALDLFAARWVYLDSQQRKTTRWVASLLIFSIMMAGPAGLLVYFVYRWFKKKDEGHNG